MQYLALPVKLCHTSGGLSEFTTKYFISNTLYGTHTLLSTTLGSYKANSDCKLIRRKTRLSHACEKQPVCCQYQQQSESIVEFGLINLTFMFSFGLL